MLWTCRRHRSAPSISGCREHGSHCPVLFMGNLRADGGSAPTRPPSRGWRQPGAVRCWLAAILNLSGKAEWEAASAPRASALPSAGAMSMHPPGSTPTPPGAPHAAQAARLLGKIWVTTRKGEHPAPATRSPAAGCCSSLVFNREANMWVLLSALSLGARGTQPYLGSHPHGARQNNQLLASCCC